MSATAKAVGLALIAAVAGLAMWPPRAAAHAFPAGASPPVGGTIDSAPSDVDINFDGPIESVFARLAVTDIQGHDETNGAAAVSPDHRRLSAPLKPLAPGEYTVKWSVISRDGHRSEGSYTFTVAGDRRP